ncbi:MAG: hypothetical protein F4107_14340 [Gemmatimonadetes bacterium]|nr:hypothetical protein [Gemmatimonadota bacterium]MDE2676702.1 hypothetical protein [Gemmatimonadota bacterium]MXX34228.1 hypothetical protein [Gemmatimonadota bacterium]MYD14155.1 hypothetical protein [Gemmatimonadota bacterium]MYI67097.1 hypothetical protein [Gemmatimonadota bacterium]
MTRILIRQFLLWLMIAPCGPVLGQTPAGEGGDSASTRPGRFQSADSLMPGNSPTLERDTFTYVAAGRRDPFLPASGPTPLEDSVAMEVEVLGIISHTDPRLSVVVVRAVFGRPAAGGQTGDAAAVEVGGTRRLRLGDRIGNTRILAIHEHHIVVEAEGPAGTERRVVAQSGPRQGCR